MFSFLILVSILGRELLNVLKGALKGKIAITDIVVVLLLIVALYLKSAGL